MSRLAYLAPVLAGSPAVDGQARRQRPVGPRHIGRDRRNVECGQPALRQSSVGEVPGVCVPVDFEVGFSVTSKNSGGALIAVPAVCNVWSLAADESRRFTGDWL